MIDYERRPSILRSIWPWIVIISLIAGSFYGGIILANKTEIDEKLIDHDTVFLGTVLNKYKNTRKENLSNDVDFELFWDVWDLIKSQYVDSADLSEKEMFYGALRGLVASTDDPYSVFMNPVVSKEFQDDLNGTFEGIGAEIGIKGGVLTIVAPLTDMPAAKAGLRAGDKILSINGETTNGMMLDLAVSKIRGEEGTEVTLNIWRESFEEPRDFNITRGKIIVKSVRWEFRPSRPDEAEDDIAYIEISNFNHDTADLFDRAIKELIAKNSKGLILDLRNNPGGFLDTAIEMASEWVEGEIVVIEKFSEDNQREYLARGRARLKDLPTVVLVNEGSASASEIVAGALKDHGKATIIGQKTFGKGSVQELTELNDGSSLKITVAKWLTPNGISINDEGVSVDIEVDLIREDYEQDKDPQLDKAMEVLNNPSLLLEISDETVDEAVE
ncbi:MAG: S41 family peptidase [bacterium]|nr:S41 family peptidase [bacterium]